MLELALLPTICQFCQIQWPCWKEMIQDIFAILSAQTTKRGSFEVSVGWQLWWRNRIQICSKSACGGKSTSAVPSSSAKNWQLQKITITQRDAHNVWQPFLPLTNPLDCCSQRRNVPTCRLQHVPTLKKRQLVTSVGIGVAKNIRNLCKIGLTTNYWGFVQRDNPLPSHKVWGLSASCTMIKSVLGSMCSTSPGYQTISMPKSRTLKCIFLQRVIRAPFHHPDQPEIHWLRTNVNHIPIDIRHMIFVYRCCCCCKFNWVHRKMVFQRSTVSSLS